MIAACLWIIPRVKNSGDTYLLTRSNNRDSVIAYVLLLVDGVVANNSLGHYAVIGLGLVAMISFVLLALRRSRNKLKLESPGKVPA